MVDLPLRLPVVATVTYPSNNRNRCRHGRGGGQSTGAPSLPNAGSSSTGPWPIFPNTPWAAGYNPWQGLVQAWPMPFPAPAAGVLGPWPGAPNQQAFVANGLLPPQYVGYAIGQPTYDPNALLAALANAGVPFTGTRTSDWFLNTGASSHMASSTGNLHSIQPLSSSTSVTVGNGASLPVTHLASSSVPTSFSPLSLRNELITPLIKNLISVRSLTRDNAMSVEFDPYGFSIKDLHTRQVKL